MKRNIFLVIVMIATFYSCNDSNGKISCNIDTSKFKLEEVKNQYSLEFPENMTVTKALNADASLQLEDIFEEMYAAVIDEPKQEFIENFKLEGSYDDNLSTVANYRAIQLGLFTEGMIIKSQSDPTSLLLNDLPAEQVELVAFPAGLDIEIYYLITFVEGSDKLYMLLEWTIEANEDKHKETFQCIAKTFEEI